MDDLLKQDGFYVMKEKMTRSKDHKKNEVASRLCFGTRFLGMQTAQKYEAISFIDEGNLWVSSLRMMGVCGPLFLWNGFPIQWKECIYAAAEDQGTGSTSCGGLSGT